MSQQTVSTDLCPSRAQVWARLATELREQAIHLMAQLALNLVLAQSDWPTREFTRDRESRQTKDPF
jgi:hypothetical protein